MQQIIGLFFKDFMGFFRSYTGFAVIFVYLSISSLLTFYGGNFFSEEDAPLYAFFSVQPLVLSFVIPLLAAKAIGSEYDKSGNFEFLLTQPLKYKNILLSKAWAIFVFALLLILLSVIPLWKFSEFVEIEPKLLFSSYCGLILLALILTLISALINLFIKNIFAAYMTAMFICIIFFNVDFSWISSVILSLFGIYSPSTEYALSINGNYEAFILGEITLPAVLLFVVFTLLLAFIGYLVFAQNRGEYKKREASLSIVFAVFAAIFFLLASKMLFSRAGFDLTPDKEYTLKQKSYDISNNLDQKVHIKLYISDKVSEVYPSYEKYISYVISIFEKYASATNNLSFEIINPKPYSVEAENAKQTGMEPILDDDGNQLYFGAEFIAEDNRSEVIPLFLKERKNQLETDISFILHSLAKNYNKPIIGIVAPNIPVLRKTYNYEYKNMALIEKLSQHYKLVSVSDGATSISPEIQTLLIINPHDFSRVFAYTLDQYVMMGGNVVIFADPYSEEEVKYASLVQGRGSNLTSFLANYGLFFTSEFTSASYKYAAKMLANKENPLSSYDYPLWIDLPAKNIGLHEIAGNLSNISFKTAGIADKLQKSDSLKNVEFKPILKLDENNGMTLSELIARDNVDLNKSRIMDIKGELYLGMLARGSFWSAFDQTSSDDENITITYSVEPATVALIADSDFLFNDSVIKTENSVDIKPYLFIEKNDNLQFLLNLLAYIGGDEQYNVLRKSVVSGVLTSANTTMKQNAAQKYKEDLSRISSQIAMLDLKIGNAEKNMRYFQILNSPEEVKAINEMKQQKEELIAEKMKFEYNIESDFESAKADLIIKSILWIPLFVTLIIFALMLLLSDLKKKYIRRIIR